MKRFAANRKNRIFLIVLCVLFAASLLCAASAAVYSGRLYSQKAAERWQGDNEVRFAQISCFIPHDSAASVEDVYSFRYAMIKAMQDASIEVGTDSGLWNDAWSCTGKASVSSTIGRGEASVTAVGGDFFNFHPIRLVNGSYIKPQDLMQDRVLLDRELSWLLYGSSDVQGLSLDIEGRSFVVAGVIEREADKVSTRAYRAGMGLYMSYDAYLTLREGAGISCYEFVMAEPVKGFARSTAETAFPIKDAEIVDNTHRFETLNVMKIALDPFERAMQTAGIVYPYWENAARYTESLCGTLLLWAAGLMCIPAGTAVFFAVRAIIHGKRRLDDELIPETKEKISERIRIIQRRRWEKYHGKH